VRFSNHRIANSQVSENKQVDSQVGYTRQVDSRLIRPMVVNQSANRKTAGATWLAVSVIFIRRYFVPVYV